MTKRVQLSTSTIKLSKFYINKWYFRVAEFRKCLMEGFCPHRVEITSASCRRADEHNYRPDIWRRFCNKCNDVKENWRLTTIVLVSIIIRTMLSMIRSITSPTAFNNELTNKKVECQLLAWQRSSGRRKLKFFDHSLLWRRSRPFARSSIDKYVRNVYGSPMHWSPRNRRRSINNI